MSSLKPPHSGTGVLEGNQAPFSKVWFNAFSNLFRNVDGAGSVTQIATVDASDLPSAIALANANKAKINEIISKLEA